MRVKHIFLLCLLLIGVSITRGYAQFNYIIGDYKVLIYNNEALIYEYMGKAATVTIPSEFTVDGESYPVTEILYGAFEGKECISEVVFPDNLRTIEDCAFYGCTNLWRLHFPETLTEIGFHAFEGLKNLQTLVLPNSELVIGDSAFSECDKLSYVLIPEKVKSFRDYVFSGCNNIICFYGLGTEAPEVRYATFDDMEGMPRLYYPEGYLDSWLSFIGFRFYSRTTPAICLDMVSVATSVGAQGSVIATAYGYLGATIESIEWESRNTSVVTVDQDGLVTAVGPGRTSVYCTVTDSNGETASASCTFQVKESTGVESVTPENEDISEEYFTLQGLSAGSDRSALAPGIYIRRQGNDVTKIIVR